mmetsp:Transcript_14825/g.21785  ORF Transcript_14825/g.21785 Transcript_14825/m.21785 type:complete len:126 (+) Transcript_14825:1446-1823(+)
MTKALPETPMKARIAESSVVLLIRPVHIVGIPDEIRTKPMIHRAPYLSHSGPHIARKTTAPADAQIEDVQICSLLIPRDFFTSRRRGAIANQVAMATKNPIQAKWKPRIWGRAAEKRNISVDLSL